MLAVVLYKLNDYFKQEKWQLAQNQMRTKIVSVKTSVSSQIATLKNVLSSYEQELVESKINWVQLNPFFGIARAQRVGGQNSTQYRVTQFIGRSGSVGEKWNTNYLEKALSLQIPSTEQAITAQLFQDKSGAKYMTLRFADEAGHALIVVGGADYFQKYFDADRAGKTVSLLQTTDHVLAAHNEADYLATIMDDSAFSSKKYLIEKEDIAGTNLVAMNLISRKALTKDFAVPWSIVGLIIGFGLMIVGILSYTIEPLDRRIEKYRMQEREQIFKETLSENLAPVQTKPVEAKPVEVKSTPVEIVKAKIEIPDSFNEGLGAFPQDLIEIEIQNQLEHTHTSTTVTNDQQTGIVDLDPEQAEDGLDLDKALSLDDLESEDLIYKSVDFIQDQMTSKKINISEKTNLVSQPTFEFQRKEFKVESINVSVRRPLRT